jgi:hypothetical protein
MTWQEYTGPTRRGQPGLAITVLKNRRLALSDDVVHALDSDWVKLYFDPERTRLGLRAAEEHEEGALKISQTGPDQSWAVGAVGYMRQFGITVDEAVQLPVYQDGEFWVANLAGIDGLQVET